MALVVYRRSSLWCRWWASRFALDISKASMLAFCVGLLVLCAGGTHMRNSHMRKRIVYIVRVDRCVAQIATELRCRSELEHFHLYVAIEILSELFSCRTFQPTTSSTATLRADVNAKTNNAARALSSRTKLSLWRELCFHFAL